MHWQILKEKFESKFSPVYPPTKIRCFTLLPKRGFTSGELGEYFPACRIMIFPQRHHSPLSVWRNTKRIPVLLSPPDGLRSVKRPIESLCVRFKISFWRSISASLKLLVQLMVTLLLMYCYPELCP